MCVCGGGGGGGPLCVCIYIYIYMWMTERVYFVSMFVLCVTCKSVCMRESVCVFL